MLRLRMFEDRMQRRIFGSKEGENNEKMEKIAK
jgi:hypothetical protein